MTLPTEVQRLFYRYHADRLDTSCHAALIIPTVLSDGTVEDWEWLFYVYGWDALQAWMMEHSEILPPPMERFWTLILQGAPKETPRWTGGNARRKVPEGALPGWFPDDLR